MEIAEIIKQYAAKTTGLLGVGYKNLKTGDEFYVNRDTLFPSASVFKVPVLVELFNQLEHGIISMDDKIELTEDKLSVDGGILEKLSLGIKLPLRDYVTLMMIISDNTATDIIVRLLGKDKIAATIASMGLTKTTVDYDCKELILLGLNIPVDTPRDKIYKMLDSGDYTHNDDMYMAKSPKNDYTTPWEITEIFSQIYFKKLVSEKACDEMMAIMESCETNHRLPYLLPKDGPGAVTKIIHKTGTLHKVVNDAGIIISDKHAYILSAFYNGYNASPEERDGHPGSSFGERLIAEMSRDVFAALK